MRDRKTEFQTTMQLVQVQKVATDDAGLRAVFGCASTRTPRSEAGRHVHELLPLLRCSFAFPPVMGCRRHCATLFQGASGERQRAVTGKGRLPFSCTFSFQYVLRTFPESDFLTSSSGRFTRTSARLRRTVGPRRRYRLFNAGPLPRDSANPRHRRAFDVADR